jgi:hypothetical protein
LHWTPTTSRISISPTGDPQWNIIMWMDHRAIAETEAGERGRLRGAALFGGRALARNGAAETRVAAPPHARNAFERAGKFLDLADFLVYRSTGNNLRSECTMGCKWTYLPAEKRWDMRLLQGLGIESILERGRAGEAILPLGSSAGTLTPRAASELGLSTRTQVAIGIVDAHAGTIGLLGAVWAGDPAPSLEKLGARHRADCGHFVVLDGALARTALRAGRLGTLLRRGAAEHVDERGRAVRRGRAHRLYARAPPPVPRAGTESRTRGRLGLRGGESGG